jgi:RIO-like serine/threonine protein kinase
MFFFFRRLKRRLEQFEQEREVERMYINQMFAKREANIKARLHKDRVFIS